MMECPCPRCNGKLHEEPQTLPYHMVNAVESVKEKLSVAERVAMIADELQGRGGFGRYVSELNSIYEVIDDIVNMIIDLQNKATELGDDVLAIELGKISKKLF
ncbi:hypothetical protein LG52_2978 [Geobacillus kaustophilus]|uniref:Uncharacterized protein n=1 Tax=Geobacillus kaustophilus TaxID=1462 RepID=A0A0D8BUI1_GEOKU|nr:hypothetical protein [Geobacillus kaustophilus]KJE27821.1 hypothetical protein LG52_2978 [Geobacillus kaustophilus]